MYKKISILAIVAILSANTFLSAAYAGPIFSRTDKEWEKLKDNTLEYSEIEDLIEEYNPDVLENNIKLNDFKREYGNSNSTLRDRYREMADEILSNIVEPEPENPLYVGILTANLQAKNSAMNMLDLADKSQDDINTMRLGFENAKLGLVKSAKNNMISYYSMNLDVESLELAYELALMEEEVKSIQSQNGSASKLALINAQSNTLEALKNLNQIKAKKDNIEQKLIVMCGWKYSSKADIAQLPIVDVSKIDNINLDEDIRKAIDNNFTLRINKQRLANSSFGAEVESLNDKIKSNTANIENDIRGLYQSILSAKKDYEHAKALYDAWPNSIEAIEKKMELGLISRIEAKKQKYYAKEAEVAFKKAQFNLLNVMENYDIAIKGLASAGQ